MKLVRCGVQSGTLEEFYTRLKGEIAHYDQGAPAMIKLIERLRELPIDCQVWGLTSHARLCLLSKDSYESPWFVIIQVLDEHNYFIEYLMKDEDAPWPSAFVKGVAQNERDAVEMILTAMLNSGGWSYRKPAVGTMP